MAQVLTSWGRGGSALQALGLLWVPHSLATRQGHGPAALFPTSLPRRLAGRGPGRETELKDHSPGAEGLHHSIISALNV